MFIGYKKINTLQIIELIQTIIINKQYIQTKYNQVCEASRRVKLAELKKFGTLIQGY